MYRHKGKIVNTTQLADLSETLSVRFGESLPDLLSTTGH